MGISACFQLCLLCFLPHETAPGPGPGEIKEEKPLIEVRDLVKRYGRRTAVDRLSFTVEGGQA